MWKTSLGTVQYVINNTYHSSIKCTPSKLLLGYEQRNHTDSKLTNLVDLLAQIDTNIEEERDVCRDTAIIATKELRDYNKIIYDNRHKKPSQYKVGDYVLVRDLQTKPGENRKLKPCYKGPYMVSKVLNKNRFVIKDIPGCNLTSRSMNTILSPDKLKPYVKPIIIPDET